MILNVWLNGKKISEEISADTLLIDFVRDRKSTRLNSSHRT